MNYTEPHIIYFVQRKIDTYESRTSFPEDQSTIFNVLIELQQLLYFVKPTCPKVTFNFLKIFSRSCKQLKITVLDGQIIRQLKT